MLRRVKKEDFKADSWVKPDGLATCLDCWKDWMLSDDRDLSASRMQFRGGAEDDAEKVAYESNPNDEQRKADYVIGAATGAVIDDLKAVHRWAIYKKCSITTVWRFPNMDLIAAVSAAEEVLTEKLKKNIATENLFQ